MTAASAQWPEELPLALAAAMDQAAMAGGPFSPARSAALDAREEFPAAECAVLDSCGIARAYVPAELGGARGGLPELVESLRTVARRDLTVAVAHGKTFLGAISTWVAGTAAQRRELADLVIKENAVVSWGLTEPGRGSDLLAGGLTATRAGGGRWRLNGEKWPINNATRGRLISVIARTRPAGGARGFSVFLVDKAALAAGSWSNFAKEPTHGIRGADISGIRFHDAEIPGDALIGQVGDGLEIVLRALHLTRTVSVSLSLGAGEHALRLAGEFAADREMYGTRLIELPLAQRTLGRAAASLALAEAAALLAARCAHYLPGEMSVVSAAVKAGLPEIVQQAIDDLAELLGARGFLTTHHAYGMFQKLERDHRIVSIFDGSTAVNRSALIAQFPVVSRLMRSGTHDEAGLAAAVAAPAPLPDLDFAALRLTSRTGCSPVQGLPAAAARLARLAEDGSVPPRLHELAAALAEEARSVAQRMAALRPLDRTTAAEGFAVARRFELCFAGACAVHLLLAAAGDTERETRLTAALERSLELLRPGHQVPADAYDPLLSMAETTLEAVR